MPTLKDILDAMSASWSVALAVLLASGAILLSDVYEVRYVQDLPNWVPGVSFVAATLSGSVLVVALVQKVIDLAMIPVRRRRVAKQRAADFNRLVDLPDDEASLMLWAVANNKQAFTADMFDHKTRALVAKRLIFIAPGHHQPNKTLYIIPDHVWEHLRAELRDDQQLNEFQSKRLPGDY